MKIPIGKEEDAQFEMAPMIDMVFLLLVFFMIASRMSVMQNIELEIPTASNAVVPKERPQRFVINITEAGIVHAGPIEMGSTDSADALTGLRDMVKERKEEFAELKVYLRADQMTDHVHVRRVMGVMAEMGIDDFIFGAFIPEGGQ